jgi:hypothetical protein
VRWIALYLDNDPHPRLFDRADSALHYLEFWGVSESALEQLAQKLREEGAAEAISGSLRCRLEVT